MRIIDVRSGAVVVQLSPDDALLLADACRVGANHHQEGDVPRSALCYLTACYMDALARLAAATTHMRLAEIDHLQSAALGREWSMTKDGGQ